MIFKNKKGRSEVIPEGQFEIAAFKGKEIRRVLQDNEWYYSVVDVVEAITDTASPSRYWNQLKAKLVKDEGYDDLFDNIEKVKMPGVDGKFYLTDGANVETMFRIVQSIPSKKAEPLKRWLAKTGYERILEYQNPDIAIKRAILDYKRKGHTDEWIEARISCIAVREDLTKEWGKRGIEGQQYAILTNLIHQKTFDISVQQHQTFKGLQKQSLRDHMTSTELLFTRLGEASTKDIAVAKDALGFRQNEDAAKDGGQIAGNARRALERQTNQRVVSPSNHLPAKSKQDALPDSGD